MPAVKNLDALFIEPRDDGAIIKVWAVPGASRERVIGLHGDALKVAVAAPPEKGRANKRITQVLAEALQVSASSILLVSGASSRDKKMLIRGFAVEKLKRLLAANMQG